MSQWPRSNKVPALYIYSSWAVVCLGIFMVFVMTPWFKQLEAVKADKLLLQLLGGVIGVVGAPASMIILLGMLVYCAREDHSSTGVKILWFTVFFATASFGAAAYFFTVYTRQVRGVSPPAPHGGGLEADRPGSSAEVPVRHDPVAGGSCHTIAEPVNEDRRKRIPSFLLRAKHWQLFLPLTAWFILQILGLSIGSISVSSWHELAARDWIVMTVWEFGLLCLLAWSGSIGLFLRSIERPELRMRARFFRISLAAAALYSVIYIPSQVCKASALKTEAVGVPLDLLWVVNMVYILYFVSKNLVMAERGVQVSFDQYVGWFFLYWFFPIGVWIIQPKINRLFRNQAGQERTFSVSI
jgi:hypothetical protein